MYVSLYIRWLYLLSADYRQYHFENRVNKQDQNSGQSFRQCLIILPTLESRDNELGLGYLTNTVKEIWPSETKLE